MAASRGRGMRALVGFWIALAVMAAGGAVALHLLGAPRAEVPAAPAAEARSEPAPTAAEGPPPPRATTPRPADGRPRVAVLLSGLGVAQADTEAALALPGAVSLAVSPYAPQPAGTVAAALEAGHEVLSSIPMEPNGYPLNDAGDRALLTALPPEENRARLRWTLDRMQGVSGGTNALGSLRGERFAGSDQAPVFLAALVARDWLWVDARPDATRPPVPGLRWRAADLVLDDPPTRADIAAHLARLEQAARDHGTALGIAGPPTRALVERLAEWAAGLEGRGILLVPAGALAEPDPTPPAAPQARLPRPSFAERTHTGADAAQ